MDIRSSEGPRGSMAITWIAGRSRHLAAASRLFSDLLSRPLHLIRIWSEERHRARAATKRCEELRIGRGTALSFRDRVSKTRQVFDETYAGK
jgi:hypothetical protein